MLLKVESRPPLLGMRMAGFEHAELFLGRVVVPFRNTRSTVSAMQVTTCWTWKYNEQLIIDVPVREIECNGHAYTIVNPFQAPK